MARKKTTKKVVKAPPKRRRLPKERVGITHKFQVGAHEGYITVGLFEDGTPGELFIRMSKEGSTVSGFADSFAIVCSMALQYGVPLSTLVRKFSHMRFVPDGMTGNRNIPMAKSVVDYVFRWMAFKFLTVAEAEGAGVQFGEDQPQG